MAQLTQTPRKRLWKFKKTCFCKDVNINCQPKLCNCNLIGSFLFVTRVRRHVLELLNSIRNDSKVDYDRQLNIRISQLTKFLPDPVKASEFLCKFSTDLKNDKNLTKIMETIVNPATDCKTCAEQTVSYFSP